MRRDPTPNKAPRFRLLSLLGLLLVGCSTLTYYPERASSFVQMFEEGDLAGAFAQCEKRSGKGLNHLLYLLEGGMILHTKGELKQSNRLLEEAERIIRYHEEKAVLSLSQGTAQLSSLIINEKTLPYRGEGFEKVLVNTFKAMNYLFQRDYEGARVEIRRSFARQQEIRRLYEKEWKRVEEIARSRGIRPGRLRRQIAPYYEDETEIVRSVRNLYEDAFAYYLSAVVYEMNREYNDAYIDLKRVQELRPGIPYVENDLLRMAGLARLSDLLTVWIERLGRKPRFPDRSEEGEVLVVFECGMAPRKTEIRISIPIRDVGVVTIALPKYRPVPNRINHASLSDTSGRFFGRTFVLSDLEAIAIRNLHDRMPSLLLKQVLRATMKAAMAKTARDEGGWAAELAATLFTNLTEQADLRSWLTLPANIQVARITLPSGMHKLFFALEDEGGRVLQREPLVTEIQPGQTRILKARSGPSGLIALQVF